MDGDEVRPGHVPVHVLEGQRQVAERVQAILQQRGDPVVGVGLHTRHGVCHHGGYAPVSCDYLSAALATCGPWIVGTAPPDLEELLAEGRTRYHCPT
jgi:hypothetical protein